MKSMEKEINAHLGKEQAEMLRNLLWLHERAIRAYTYAKGLRAGLNKTGHFLVDPERALTECAVEATVTEKNLYDYIETLEK